MKKILALFFCLSLVLGLTALAAADSFTFDMGDDSWVDVSDTGDALELWAYVNPLLDLEIFTLNEGDSHTFWFAEIGTDEDWINSDDTATSEVIAWVDFDVPGLMQDVSGDSWGWISGLFGFSQGWYLVWNDPVTVDFYGGGQFELALSDLSYSSGWWQGPDGSADVYATVTLTKAPVPEPGTVLLLGGGLLGLVLLGRRRLFKS